MLERFYRFHLGGAKQAYQNQKCISLPGREVQTPGVYTLKTTLIPNPDAQVKQHDIHTTDQWIFYKH